MFKTPHFWYKDKTLTSNLLLPVSWIYQIGHNISQSRNVTPYKASIPVICVGNAIAGGGGKTPMVIALVNALKESGSFKNPFILTRGYGSKTSDAILVDKKAHKAEAVGDEPLLLAEHASTIVCADRANGAKLAESNGADIIIMDDGLLNQALHKDLSFLVVDRKIDFGNNKTIPAGPLREPLSKVLSRIDAVITIGRPFDAADHPVFETNLIADKKPDPDKKYSAFAGIAIPDKFKNTLLDLNYNLASWSTFPDHHPYSAADIEVLKKTEGQLITTEKDYVRLPEDFKKKVETLPISIEIKAPDSLIKFIKDNVSSS